MAITKVSQYNSTPTAVSDYQAQNAHLQAFINQLNGSVSVLNQSATTVVPTIKQGSYISMGGTAYIVDTEDYTILGSLVAGLNYIALAVSGDSLTATWAQTITSYSWNPIYNYYSDSTNALLPYAINFSSSNYYISQFNQNFRQPLNPDSDVEFNDIEANKTTSLFQFPDISTGSNIVRYNTEVNSINSIAGKTISSFRCPCSGSLSVLVDLKTNNSSNAAIFEITGGNSTLTLTTSSTEYSTKTGTISFDFNDILTIRLTKSTSETAVVSCENIYLKGSRIPYAIENVAWNA